MRRCSLPTYYWKKTTSSSLSNLHAKARIANARNFYLVQRLVQIARTQPDAATQQAAVAFLGDLLQNTAQWGQHARIKQAGINALGRLAALSAGPLSDDAQE